MVELANDIKLAIMERIKSPIMSAFVISWCLINHNFLLILFSDMYVIDKINKLNSMYTTCEIIGNYVVLPLLSALIFVFSSAFLKKYWYPILIRWEVETKNKKDKNEKELLVERKELDKLNIQLVDERNKHFEELAKRIDDIKILQDRRGVLEKELKEIKEQYEFSRGDYINQLQSSVDQNKNQKNTFDDEIEKLNKKIKELKDFIDFQETVHSTEVDSLKMEKGKYERILYFIRVNKKIYFESESIENAIKDSILSRLKSDSVFTCAHILGDDNFYGNSIQKLMSLIIMAENGEINMNYVQETLTISSP